MNSDFFDPLQEEISLVFEKSNVTEEQLVKYQQELIEEGLLEAQSNLKF